MKGGAARKAAGGRRQQARAAAVVKGGMTGCTHTEERATGTWVCIRPRHGGDHPAQDHYRRTHGEPVAADRHYLVKRPA